MHSGEMKAVRFDYSLSFFILMLRDKDVYQHVRWNCINTKTSTVLKMELRH